MHSRKHLNFPVPLITLANTSMARIPGQTFLSGKLILLSASTIFTLSFAFVTQ